MLSEGKWRQDGAGSSGHTSSGWLWVLCSWSTGQSGEDPVALSLTSRHTVVTVFTRAEAGREGGRGSVVPSL